MQRIDGEWVDVAHGRVDEIRGKQTGELIETALHVGALDACDRGRAARPARHGGDAVVSARRKYIASRVRRARPAACVRETLLDMTAQKTLLEGVFPA